MCLGCTEPVVRATKGRPIDWCYSGCNGVAILGRDERCAIVTGGVMGRDGTLSRGVFLIMTANFRPPFLHPTGNPFPTLLHFS